MGETYLPKTAHVYIGEALYAQASDRAGTFISGAIGTVTSGPFTGLQYWSPGSVYTTGGFWLRDFIYTLEHVPNMVTAEQIAPIMEWILANISASYEVPDHIQSNGVPVYNPMDPWGSGSAVDNQYLLTVMAWHYGRLASFDSTWQTWFSSAATVIEAAFNQPTITGGLVTTTGGRVTWGFVDTISLSGGNIGCSILARNAACCLADMFDRIGNSSKQSSWDSTATTIGNAVRAAFVAENSGLWGFLPWTSGGNAGHFSPDLTGYAAWSGILDAAQMQQAGRMLADYYASDKLAGGAGQVFNFTAGFRGAIRQQRISDNTTASVFVPEIDDYADMPSLWADFIGEYVNYGTYQNGAYWYYQVGWVAYTISRYNMAIATELLEYAIFDACAVTQPNLPPERVDYGRSPVNLNYMVSAAALSGIAVEVSLLIVANSVAPAVAENITLIFHGTLTISDAAASTVGENVSLVQPAEGTLVVADSISLAFAGNITITLTDSGSGIRSPSGEPRIIRNIHGQEITFRSI